jgi:hypothetical protein
VLGQHPGDAGGHPAATGGGKEPVADLHDRPLGVEVVEDGPAEDPAAGAVGDHDGSMRRLSASAGRPGSIATISARLSLGQVAGLEKLGVVEGREEVVDVASPAGAARGRRGPAPTRGT